MGKRECYLYCQYYIVVSHIPFPCPSLPPSSLSLSLFLLQVTFIDYGNTQTVALNYLCKLSRFESQLPAQAMECFLTCVSPCSMEGGWSEVAIARFEELVRDKRLEAKVRGR